MLFDPRRHLRHHRSHRSNLGLGHGVTVRTSRAADSRDDRVMSDFSRSSGSLLRYVYEEVSRGNPKPLVDALADHVSWTIIGTTPLSGTYQSKQAVLDDLFGALRARLSTPVVFSIDRIIEDGEWAVMMARGSATSVQGGPYDNTDCIVAHVVDGRFDELTDYVDTELISRALFGATE